jgi:hypothetical protein
MAKLRLKTTALLNEAYPQSSEALNFRTRGMQDRLSNDADVLQSMSSPGLLEVAAAAAGAIRFRNVEDLDCEILAMKVMPDNVHLFLN